MDCKLTGAATECRPAKLLPERGSFSRISDEAVLFCLSEIRPVREDESMARRLFVQICLLLLCLFHPVSVRSVVPPDLPDLVIKQFEFVETNDKWLRVLVENKGKRTSRPCQLELAVRKINGVGATRNATEPIPTIEPGKEEWVTVNTSGILQSAIRLREDTSFRLRVDETNLVTESNEDNNELWHNQD